MKKGLLIILSGPSGVGKGTVRAELFKRNNLNLAYSISMTTRAPREGEIDGKDYFFVTQERFNEAIRNDELLEYATFVKNSYGTPKSYVEKLRNEGKNVVLEIEINGAKQVMKKVKDSISLFIIPPSIEELKHRLIERHTENEDVINQRIETAKYELTQKSIYSHVIVNDDVNRCADEIESILLKYINN